MLQGKLNLSINIPTLERDPHELVSLKIKQAANTQEK